MSDFLGPILERVRAEVVRRHRKAFFRRMLERCDASFDGNLSAVAALRRPQGESVRAIAEIKFRSPSAGSIRPWCRGEVAGVAASYEANGASAVSVLTDRIGFGGSPDDVRRAHRAVRVPILYKGFVLDEIQVVLAREVGATLVLLLVRALSRSRLDELVRFARSIGLEPVVEAKDADELEVALATGAPIVGINARDLGTFKVDVDSARRSLERVPPERVAVLMSGIRTREDVIRANDGRADALLVGEGLMRAPDPGRKLAELLSGAAPVPSATH